MRSTGRAFRLGLHGSCWESDLIAGTAPCPYPPRLTDEWRLRNTLNINVVYTRKLGQRIPCLSLLGRLRKLWGKVAFLRQNPKIGFWKINGLRVSRSLFSVMCDRAHSTARPRRDGPSHSFLEDLCQPRPAWWAGSRTRREPLSSVLFRLRDLL